MRLFWTVLVSIFILVGGPATAKDLALVIDQQDYRRLPDLRRDSRMNAILNSLDESGFDVTLAKDATVGELRAAAFSLEAAVQGGADRLLILVRGHLVNNGQQTWVLGQESATPDRFDIGGKGLPLDVFDPILADVAGRAVLVVMEDPRPLGSLADLTAGAGSIGMPQGASLIQGSSAPIERAITTLLQEGATIADVAALNNGPRVFGFVSSQVPFSGSRALNPNDLAPANDVGEIAYWSAVRDIGTSVALNAYLRRYPNGAFSADARRQIQARVNDRETRIKETEQALGLSRDRRRTIQRNLAILGYDPRGADGVFGPATRRAISAWQADQGLETHGYLDRDQLSLMQEFALRRSAELEEEARRRREIEDARDRAFWQDTGSRGTEDGYRRYLRSFPDGLFSDRARSAVREYEEARRPDLSARERAAWDVARDAGTPNSYQRYIREYPNGDFVAEARDRLAALGEDRRDREVQEQLAAREQGIAGNTAAKILIERRLSNLKLEPGPIDGRFTRETRRALQKFQKARGLDVTGYVDQPTMVQLLLGR